MPRHPQIKHKLTPQPWAWNGSRPGPRWLGGFPPDVPVVWSVWLPDDPAILSDLTALLSSTEHDRLARLKPPADKQRFLAGRGLLRILAGAQLDLPPARVQLDLGPFGKPFIVPPDGAVPLHFNVSHSGKLVLLAFSPAHEVGVDVEEMRGDLDYEAIARRVFPAEEYRGWTLLAPADRLTAFFRAWTRHEAALKTLGSGFTDEPDATADPRLEYFDLAMPANYQAAAARLR